MEEEVLVEEEALVEEDDLVEIDINKCQNYEKHLSPIDWKKAIRQLEDDSLTKNFLSIAATSECSNNFKNLFDATRKIINDKPNHDLDNNQEQLKVAFNAMLLCRNTWSKMQKGSKEINLNELNSIISTMLTNETCKVLVLDSLQTLSFDVIVEKLFATYAKDALVPFIGYQFINIYVNLIT